MPLYDQSNWVTKKEKLQKTVLCLWLNMEISELIRIVPNPLLVLGKAPVMHISGILGQVKKTRFSSGFLSKKTMEKRAGGRFFCYLLFPIACFLYTLLPSPRDTLELLDQILIKRNIRYWLNPRLFNYDTHKRLTVKIYIILVCIVTPVGFCS